MSQSAVSGSLTTGRLHIPTGCRRSAVCFGIFINFMWLSVPVMPEQFEV